MQQLGEIRTAAENPNVCTPGVSYEPDLVSGRSVSDRQLWGDAPTFTGASPAQVISRATRILERSSDFADVDPDAVERLGVLAERGEANNEAARWAIAISDPGDASAVTKTAFGANEDGRLRWTDVEPTAYLRVEEVRASMSTTVGNGGYLVPFALDPTILLNNAGSMSPFRQISRRYDDLEPVARSHERRFVR